ncbi:sulfotransferase family 2 domain-containing protein [Dokdonia ponticola]|uniref:Sulfotransferase family 2 domain-containing protein n=1 Tax=Dokdonia ponticola TaxID=2041041 RepID=A0ABV9HVT5_9FLAO
MHIYYSLLNIHRRLVGTHQRNADWSKVELVSIHIPKTAGTSFMHSLKKQYGHQKVTRIDISDNRTRINTTPIDNAYVYKNTTVIHGHFTIHSLNNHFSLPPNIPIITWLRDPVERVISNYYYLYKRLDEELNEEKKGLNILSKMRRSLLEYAQDERNCNRMSKFLKGIDLEDFFFIGIVENYDEDIQELNRKLNWSTLEIVTHNKTGTINKPVVDEQTKALIRSYNKKDQALYEQALALRK